MTQPFIPLRPGSEADAEAWAAYQARLQPVHGRPSFAAFPREAPFRAGPEAPGEMADALAPARRDAGLTVAQLAERLEVPEEIVGAVELGRIEAPFDYACAVLFHCGLDPDWRPPPGPERVAVGEQRCGACGHPRALHAGGQGACLSGRAGSAEGGGCSCGSFDGQGFEPRQGGVVEPLDLPPPAPVSPGAQPRRGPHPSTLAIEAQADPAATRELLEGWSVRDLCDAIDLAPAGTDIGPFAAAAQDELTRRGKRDPEGVAAAVAAARAVPGRLACSRCGAEVTRSYEPGRCYSEQGEPPEMDEHDEAEPWERVHGPAGRHADRHAPPPPPLDPVCPCQTDVEEPGQHLPTCPWSDPDYDPDIPEAFRRDEPPRRRRKIGPGLVRRIFPLRSGVSVSLDAPRELSFKDVVRLGTWLLSLAVD